MALTPGTRFGVYEVTALIGEGGMGQVYRATDTQLKRQVAIKVLPPSLGTDRDRLARFQREAEVLASLNHPNIGAIYGVEKEGDVYALVLELVEGQTLAQKLTSQRPKAIRLDEALTIARQIADALDAAHERGIVHRDLKPANIALSPDGVVKVLDFGLAKPGAGANSDEFANSPTMMAPTVEGMLLGTAPYMSPEQARGKAVDKRTDIWAFGCVLYEMLTGRPAFIGETTTDVLAKIVEREPDWTKLPPSTPPRLARLLRRCFAKDPKRRARDIGDVRMELDDETGAPGGSTPIATLRTLKAVAASASFVAALLAIAVGVLWFRRTPAVQLPTQFSFEAPSGEVLELSAPVPAPDGRRVAFVARDAAGQRALWIRRLDSLVPQRVAGTEGAIGAPFWSPDGRFVGFFGGGKLKKADLSGGAVLNICGITANLGATWSPDNVIVLAPVNRTVLHRVPAAGGTPEPITTLSAERKENSHRWPHFLPDGRHFLFTARSDVKENNLIYVGSLDSKEIKPVRAAQSNAVYVPGYLLFAQEGTLMAQRFDARALTLAGDPFPVAEHVAHNAPSSSGMFGASADGSIVTYLPGQSRLAQLSWFDRSGTRVGQPVGPPTMYDEIRLSPDGRRVAVELADADSGNRDLWMLDMAAGGLTRVTSNPANDWQAAWSPDSRELVFASDRNGKSTLYRKAIDGGDDQLLLQWPDMGVFPSDWSADGRFIALDVDLPNGNLSIWALPLSGDHKPFPLLQSDARAGEPTISPDGRWVAYQSSESSASDIYVKPFTSASRTRVSAAGGFVPRWRRDGRELFYVTPAGDIMSASIATGDTLQPAVPVRLFASCAGVSPATRGEGVGSSRAMYDVAADGSRFLLACALADTTPARITVSRDWAATLK